MRHLRLIGRVVVGLGLAMAGLSLVTAGDAAESDRDEILRPEVGIPLRAAEDLIKRQKYPDALIKLRELDRFTDLSSFERGFVERLRGSAAAGAGDYLTAAKAFEALLAEGHLDQAEQLKLERAIASFYYQTKDYHQVEAWANRYLSEGGTDLKARTLLAQSYYLTEDYPNAAKALTEQILAQDQIGKAASEQQLQLLASSTLKTNDLAGYRNALEKLVAAYPKADYWADLIHRVRIAHGFAERLQLDADRLALAVGGLNNAADYIEFAELALQAGLPGEAKAVIEAGFAKGLLGTGAEADRHKRLRDLSLRKAEEDAKTLAAGEREAANAPDGSGLVNTGLDYLGFGQADKAIALIRQGIQKGGLKHPDDAQLYLGIAYLTAGHKDKAKEALKLVQGTDGAADLARLWEIHANAPSS